MEAELLAFSDSRRRGEDAVSDTSKFRSYTTEKPAEESSCKSAASSFLNRMLWSEATTKRLKTLSVY